MTATVIEEQGHEPNRKQLLCCQNDVALIGIISIKKCYFHHHWEYLIVANTRLPDDSNHSKKYIICKWCTRSIEHRLRGNSFDTTWSMYACHILMLLQASMAKTTVQIKPALPNIPEYRLYLRYLKNLLAMYCLWNEDRKSCIWLPLLNRITAAANLSLARNTVWILWGRLYWNLFFIHLSCS